LQIWKQSCISNSKLAPFYAHIKACFGTEAYISAIDIPKLRKSLASFMSSSHSLMIEKGRYKNVCRTERFCFYCANVVEDEYHFVIQCPFYCDIRKQYIPNKCIMFPNLNKFHSLCLCTNTNIMRMLAVYIYYASKRRNVYLEEHNA